MDSPREYAGGWIRPGFDARNADELLSRWVDLSDRRKFVATDGLLEVGPSLCYLHTAAMK